MQTKLFERNAGGMGLMKRGGGSGAFGGQKYTRQNKKNLAGKDGLLPKGGSRLPHLKSRAMLRNAPFL